MSFENNLEKDDKLRERNEVLLHEGDGLMSAEQLTKCKNAVCMIRCETRCHKSGKRLIKRGSGFYAKAKIFSVEYCCIVTNNHVISCGADAAVAVAIFHFERENQGMPVQLRPDKIFQTNKELDYSVIGIDEDEINSLNPRVFPIEYTEQPQAAVGDDIFIFQHPMGMPKQFSYERIIGIRNPYVYYKADTNEGSSGSPVLWKLQLMAIHRVGSEEDGYNKGILFSAIINDLHVGNNFSNSYGTGVNNSNKRDFSCVTRNSPREMDENSCKRICGENSNSNDEKNCEASEGANLQDEQDEEQLQFADDEMLEDEKQPQFPNDETLDKLSQDCCGFYKKLARRLGVKYEKIEEISRDHVNYGSWPEKCFQVLHEWKESNASQFTNEVLEKALRSLDKNTLANKYFGKE